MIKPSLLTTAEQRKLSKKAKGRSGIRFVAWLAANDYKEALRSDNVEKFAHNYLTAYSGGVLLNAETFEKFYELVAKELEIIAE